MKRQIHVELTRQRPGQLVGVAGHAVNNGRRLYLNAYEADDHRGLAKYILPQRTLPWMMSYDDSHLIRDLYRRCKLSLLPIRYTLQTKRSENELIIAPKSVAMPFACRTSQNETLFQGIA